MMSMKIVTICASIFLLSCPALADLESNLAMECHTQYPIDEGRVKPIIDMDVLPSSTPEKCLMNCFLKKMKLVENNKLVLPNVLKYLENHYQGEDLKMAQDVVQKCDNKVNPGGVDECEGTFKIVQCIFDES